jgi:hypothetical protein
MSTIYDSRTKTWILPACPQCGNTKNQCKRRRVSNHVVAIICFKPSELQPFQ